MPSNRTAQYQLCQWEAGDQVRRTDFNEDNQKIEAGLAGLQAQLNGQVASRLAAIEAQLPSIQGNVYNLMLKRYYDGMDLSNKKMLFLDGFKNQSLIQTTTPGTWYDPELKRPRIYTLGAQSTTPAFAVEAGIVGNRGSDANLCVWLGQNSNYCTTNVSFTPSGFGKLESVTVRMAKYADYINNITVQAQIVDGGAVLSTSQTVTVTSEIFTDFVLTFPGGISLEPRAYTLRLENINKVSYLRAVYTDKNSAKLGAVYTYTPANYSTGVLESVQTNLERDYSGALAWVRHIGGSVDLAVKKPGGAFQPLTKTASRATATLTGESCIESVFQLTAVPAAPNRTVSAQLTLHADNSGCILCDYGIAFF